jgi:dTDP-4-dehydrorhamnose 3,5-epimerase
MWIPPTSLEGVAVIEHDVFEDRRGSFVELFNAVRFERSGIAAVPRQVNHSRSRRDVLRGLHFQEPHAQGKVVTVTRGEIYDVAVDVRVGSPTFGRWVGVQLSEADGRSLWVAAGFAHGFCVLSDVADVVYCATEVYHPEAERGVLWSDPGIGIEWPVATPLVSDRDARLPGLDTNRADLPRYQA